jgi:hypothetical protein
MQAANPEKQLYHGSWGDVLGMQHAKETIYDNERYSYTMFQTTQENI